MRIYNFFIIALFFCVTSTLAQNTKKALTVKTHQIDNFIKEAYKDKADAIVFSDPIRYNGFKDLLLNRITIYNQKYKEGEHYEDLANVPLLKTYNKRLSRNLYDISNFNPLKYDISFFSNEIVIYRINKQYVLVIAPQKPHQKH